MDGCLLTIYFSRSAATALERNGVENSLYAGGVGSPSLYPTVTSISTRMRMSALGTGSLRAQIPEGSAIAVVVPAATLPHLT